MHLLCQFLIFSLLAKQNDNSRYGERLEDEDMEQMMKDADLDRLVVLSFLIFHFDKEFLFFTFLLGEAGRSYSLDALASLDLKLSLVQKLMFFRISSKSSKTSDTSDTR